MSSSTARMRHRAIRKNWADLKKLAEANNIIVVEANRRRWRAEDLPTDVAVVVAKGKDEALLIILHSEDTVAIRSLALAQGLAAFELKLP